MIFQPVGGDAGSEHDRDNERPKRVTCDAFAPLRCRRRSAGRDRSHSLGVSVGASGALTLRDRGGRFPPLSSPARSTLRLELGMSQHPQHNQRVPPLIYIQPGTCTCAPALRRRCQTGQLHTGRGPAGQRQSSKASVARFYRSLVCFTSSLRLNRSPMKDIYCPTAARQPGPVIRNMSLHL